jgi:predicted RNase H-like HicB family nuclease
VRPLVKKQQEISKQPSRGRTSQDAPSVPISLLELADTCEATAKLIREHGWAPLSVKVVLHKDPEGGYSVSVPALRGCHSEGETEEEALTNIRQAIKGCLSVGAKHMDLGPEDLVREVQL